MSYPVTINGRFEFNSPEDAQSALGVIADEIENPPAFNENIVLTEANFVVSGHQVSIQYEGVISSSACYGCERIIKKMSKHAVVGSIVVSFDGEKEIIQAGRGWD